VSGFERQAVMMGGNERQSRDERDENDNGNQRAYTHQPDEFAEGEVPSGFHTNA